MKRLISLILTCALMLSLLSGCGVKPAEEKVAAVVAPTAAAAAEKAEEAKETPAPESEVAEEANDGEDQTESEQAEGDQAEGDQAESNHAESEQEATAEGDVDAEEPYVIPKFNGLSDPALLQYVEDTVYTDLVSEYQSENYIIEDVNAVYISKEYLEELSYNSQANIFFGYTLEELDGRFQGTRYVFTLGDNGETIVQPFEAYDDSYDQVIKNVAIGTGVILVCVTVSVATGGVGLTTVSAVFVASAKTATTFALSSGVFSGVFNGVLEGIQTKDFDKALKAAALAGSKSFKWGAISGAVLGGLSELAAANQAANAGSEILYTGEDAAEKQPWQLAEMRALEKYGGSGQKTFLGGKEVAHGTRNATRPDIVRTINDHLEAIEVKYYDLENPGCVNVLYKELIREISTRNVAMPAGTTQRIVLDVTNRGYNAELVERVIATILEKLADIYPNIPIDVVGLI